METRLDYESLEGLLDFLVFLVPNESLRIGLIILCFFGHNF